MSRTKSKKMKIKFVIILIISVLTISIACNKDSNDAKGEFEGGIYISNEGTYLKENGSISYFNPELDTVINEIFYKKNQFYPGDLVHSLTIHNGRAYICVRGSGKIEVTNLNFNSIGTINNLSGVRYFIGADDKKGYATSWGSSSISIIDLAGNTVSGNISLGHTGHDRMLIDNGRLFIANSGGNAVDSTISVIDIATDVVTKTINLPAYKPFGMQKDAIGNLWVLCQGRDPQNGTPTPAMLVQIDLLSLEVKNSVQLFDNQYPRFLAISPDEQTLYYGGGLDFTGIYKISTNDLTAPTTPFIDVKFYSIGVNKFNGNIFGLEAPNYTGPGKLKIYKPNGTFVKEFAVGITPGNVNY